MFFRFLFFTFLFVCHVQASELIHSIHTKDGAVYRGQLLKYDADKGIYRIRIYGGSEFNINENDIAKMSSNSVNEAQPKTQPPPVTTQLKPEPKTQAKQAEDSLNPKKLPRYSLFLGSVRHSLRFDEGNDITRHDRYNGLSLTLDVPFSHFFNGHFSHRHAIQSGKLSTIKYKQEGETFFTTPNPNDSTHLSFQSNIMFNLNPHKGFKLFLGPGVVFSNYHHDESNDRNLGLQLKAGVGYRLGNLNLQVEYMWYHTDPYIKGTESVRSRGIQLGLSLY